LKMKVLAVARLALDDELQAPCAIGRFDIE
jgi:hypothetical protein